MFKWLTTSPYFFLSFLSSAMIKIIRMAKCLIFMFQDCEQICDPRLIFETWVFLILLFIFEKQLGLRLTLKYWEKKHFLKISTFSRFDIFYHYLSDLQLVTWTHLNFMICKKYPHFLKLWISQGQKRFPSKLSFLHHWCFWTANLSKILSFCSILNHIYVNWVNFSLTPIYAFITFWMVIVWSFP